VIQRHPIKIAIIGTGNIGTDLCYRMLQDATFEVVAFVGRRADSPGIKMFENQVKYSIGNGIEGLIPYLNEVEGVFDATSAFDHRKHWEILSKAGKWVIDLTPSKIGLPIVPVLMNKTSAMHLQSENSSNYSMVTCGGQSSAPLLYALTSASTGISEVEISSSIAALSAGPATRLNIDQYIESTENLTSIVSGCSNVKAILVVNPAEPPVMMRTTVNMAVDTCDISKALQMTTELIEDVQSYVPGYELVVEPYMLNQKTVSATVKVTGAGYVLPEYAGNLDIINAAAVETAKLHSNSILDRVLQ
jgi:acetaldehyde dehydrogenase (acetylating)